MKYKHVAGVLSILAWEKVIKIQNNWITKAIGTSVHLLNGWFCFLINLFAPQWKDKAICLYIGNANLQSFREVQDRKRIKYKHVAGVLTILAWGETIKIQNNWITKAIGTTVHFVKWLIYFSYQFVHSSKKRQGNQPIYRHVQNRTYIASSLLTIDQIRTCTGMPSATNIICFNTWVSSNKRMSVRESVEKSVHSTPSTYI